MAMEYLCLYFSFCDALNVMEDAEVGRLVRGMLAYARTGEEPGLSGREEVAFQCWRQTIDRSQEVYEARCMKNRENALKKRSHAKEKAKEKEKEKEKIKVKENNAAAAAAHAGELETLTGCYRQNFGRAPQAVRDAIAGWLKVLPAEVVEAAILESAQSGAKSWNYVRTVLERCRDEGVTSAAALRPPKGNPFLQLLEDG